MTIAPARTAAPAASTSCAQAAEATARCASECLGVRLLHDGGRCGEWCLLATRTLGACADLLGVTPYEPHVDLIVAMARAGVIAAESCAVECELQTDEIESCVAAAAACRVAAAELRELIDDFGPLASVTVQAVA